MQGAWDIHCLQHQGCKSCPVNLFCELQLHCHPSCHLIFVSLHYTEAGLGLYQMRSLHMHPIPGGWHPICESSWKSRHHHINCYSHDCWKCEKLLIASIRSLTQPHESYPLHFSKLTQQRPSFPPSSTSRLRNDESCRHFFSWQCRTWCHPEHPDGSIYQLSLWLLWVYLGTRMQWGGWAAWCNGWSFLLSLA